MMKTFGLDEEKARMALEKGFRAGALMNGSALDRLIGESGIGARVEAMKRDVDNLAKSASEKSRG